ncbi:MAG: DUF2752 domain-containing protein [Saprospiraceae bacterium]|nr:DUF2752 domain-containing protein [Saprospiraceae bacterium]
MATSRWIQIIWLIGLLATPLVLWILPSNQFDSETGLIMCPSRRFFDVECYGCGMTRAVMHLHHLEWSDALFFNYGVIIVYPGLIIFWLWLVRRSLSQLAILPSKA